MLQFVSTYRDRSSYWPTRSHRIQCDSLSFACCRFAHCLKRMVYDKIGSFKERANMQRWLQRWFIQYVDGDPVHFSETTKAKLPIAGAEVVVEEVEGNPGYYSAKFFLRPHYQLEGLSVSLGLVSKGSGSCQYTSLELVSERKFPPRSAQRSHSVLSRNQTEPERHSGTERALFLQIGRYRSVKRARP